MKNKMQPFSPKFERLWRHELQRVRRPVKIDHIELHRRVELARLQSEQTVQTLDKQLTSLQWLCCMSAALSISDGVNE